VPLSYPFKMLRIDALRLCVALAAWALVSLALAADAPLAFRFESSAALISLLEVYTSEGCSSCPPADAWLSSLRRSPRLWKEFVPLDFHVDYWDHLGWRDPWGARQFSDRQQAWAQSWGARLTYTPGFVLNGKEWRDWRAQKAGPPPSHETPGLLAVRSVASNRCQVVFTPAAASTAPACEFHAALLAGGLSSDVKAGENRGRHLAHDFVVLNLREGALSRRAESFTGDFDLSPPAHGINDLALAVWVTPAGKWVPLQAVGGWLKPDHAR